MAFDAHKNFAVGVVVTAPSPALSGVTVVLGAGQGALFPAAPFNAVVWPTGTVPLSTTAEIVRVTAKATDTLTITRSAEAGGINRAIVVGDQIAAAITAKTLTDLETILAPGGVAVLATDAFSKTILGSPLVTVANNAVIALGTTALGFLFIVASYGESALYILNGTNHSTVEVYDNNGTYSGVAGTATSVNIYWSVGNARYELENKRGGSGNFILVMIGVG